MIETLAPGLLLAGTALGLFAAIRLIRESHRNTPAGWLALVLVGLSLRMTKSAILAFVPLSPAAKNVGLLGMLLVGPALWLFSRAALAERRYSRSDLIHFLPALGFGLGLWWLPNERGHGPSMAIYIAILLHLTLYTAATAWTSRHFRESPGEPWRLVTLVTSTVALYTAAWWAIFVTLPGIYIGLCALHALVSIALVASLMSRHALVGWLLQAPRYAHLKQSGSEALALLKRAETTLEERQLFRDPGLTLSRLARTLSVPEQTLSRAVNQYSREGFRAWLNRFRIAEAQKQLDAGWLNRSTLSQLSDACGFNGQSSFIRAFKLVRGMPPGRYAAQHSESARTSNTDSS